MFECTNYYSFFKIFKLKKNQLIIDKYFLDFLIKILMEVDGKVLIELTWSLKDLIK